MWKVRATIGLLAVLAGALAVSCWVFLGRARQGLVGVSRDGRSADPVTTYTWGLYGFGGLAMVFLLVLVVGYLLDPTRHGR